MPDQILHQAVLVADIEMVLHDLNLAARYAEHIILMNKGKVVASGKVGEVMSPDLLESVYGWQIRRCEDEAGFYFRS